VGFGTLERDEFLMQRGFCQLEIVRICSHI
jgi:hypothetical protein